MDFIKRVEGKIFKNYLNSSVEYHAGGYFIRKQAMYILFLNEEMAYTYQKEEGLHPNDNKYDLLAKEISSSSHSKIFKLSIINENIINMKHGIEEFQIMPSIFIENVLQDNLTEIILCNKTSTKVFSLVYSIL